MNNNEVYYIILDNGILLSKKKYNHWQEIQDEYYDSFVSSMGPWTYEELISYLEDDFRDENRWPFIKENLKGYFDSKEIVHYSDRKLNV